LEIYAWIRLNGLIKFEILTAFNRPLLPEKQAETPSGIHNTKGGVKNRGALLKS
jgi:hypothetical protein